MKTTGIVFTLLVAILPGRSSAWNIPGHMLSATIAYEILQQESPPTVGKVKAVLAQHPWQFSRWQNSLAPFAGAGRDMMLFMLASRWADDIRANDKAHHRGPWHYVNLPFKPSGQPAHVQVKPPTRYSKHTDGYWRTTGRSLQTIRIRRRGLMRLPGSFISLATFISRYTQASYSVLSIPMAIKAATKSASGRDLATTR